MNHLTAEEILELVDSYPASGSHPMALEHLRHCNECMEKFKLFQLLETDLKSMEAPEVPSGFAVRVTAKVREREAMRIFSRPAFRIFRWALVFSAIMMVGILIYYTSGNAVTLPQWQIPAAGYYVTFAICLVLVFVFDKTLSRLQK